MSKAITDIIHQSLVAKFYIHPVPQNLAQSTAIRSYFQGLTDLPLIQYRHARDPVTGTRLNSARIIFNEPLPSKNTSETPHDCIKRWRESSALVNQVPFHKRSSQFQTQTKNRSASNTTTAKSILESIPSFTFTPEDTPSKPAPHSSLLVSDPPTDLESKLLETTQIVLDSDNNVIPLDQYLDLMYLKKDESSLQGCTNFTLDLALMSREPDVISYASQNSVLDHFKIDRKQPFSQRLKALDRLRDNALHGFTGKFQ